MQRRATRRLIAVAAVFVLLFSFAPAVLGAGSAVDQAKIYMVAIGDNGQSGEKIGCGDSLVPVTRDIPSGLSTEGKIKALLGILFSLKDRDYGQSGLVNAVYASNLSVQSIELQGATAAIYLTGSVSVAGVCDEPRVEGQITAIARQFPGITNAI